MLEWLNQIDTAIFLALNGLGSPVLDQFMIWLSDTLIWIPLYAFLIFLLVRNFKGRFYVPLIGIILVITLCDQFTSTFMKPFFERPRPCHEATLDGLVIMIKGCGGAYGFASSHAANALGLGIFFHFLFRNKYTWTLLGWGLCVSYSRIYLGVHYPGDILFGGIVGWLMATIVFQIMEKTGLLSKYIQISRPKKN